MRIQKLGLSAALLLTGLTGCLQPIPNQNEGAEAAGGGSGGGRIEGVKTGAYPVATFFDEDFQQGGFTYTYGGSSKVRQVEGEGANGSEYFLKYNLDMRDYSGAAVCLWNMSFDLTPYLKTGALVFQAKGLKGGEEYMVGLVDDEKSDGFKTVVRAEIQKYAGMKSNEWTTFVIPLRDMGKRGVAWDAAKGIELPLAFQWDNVQEFRVITNKGQNPEFEVYIDNIQIVADAVEESNAPATEDWLDMDKSSDGPDPAKLKLEDEVIESFFIDDYAPGGYTYNYPSKTVTKPLESTTPGNAQVWAMYLENDYSGVTLSLGNKKLLDLTPFRKTGTLTFWIKGGPSSEKLMIGLLDDESDGPQKKVHTKVQVNDYGVVKAGEWVQVRVPLKKFPDDGSYWDADQGREISKKIDWSRIQEMRISIGRDENRPGPGKPVVFYLDQVQLTKTSKGMYDDEAFWDSFKSNAPIKTLFDFDGPAAAKWQSQHGQTADISIAVVPVSGNPAVKGKGIKTDFKPGDWFDVYLKMEDDPGAERDWTKHWGISFWMYTDKPYQSIDITMMDRDQELFFSSVGSVKGWNQILVPFKSFLKYPYYQPPTAKQNNKLDLDGVYQIGWKPGGDLPGSIIIDNVQLTNMREVKRVVGASSEAADVTGSLSKVIKDVPDIYGVNVGLWAPELIEDQSLHLHKAVRWGTVRYPGGLRSDEEDWKLTLKKKDFHVDTDEFLDWAAKVGIEPMFTANVGDGTPEMAAEWVEYTNKKRPGPKVKFWEIGNEIYGNWHKYYDKWGKDGGEAYGKRSREFILAMKKVDPSIKITVVWQLTGSWNKTVMKHVADLVDGVNVHHYAQKAGTENDQALLAVSGEADKLMEDVHQQVTEFGQPGKKYEIWLTEWNSVDFNPGAQILSHINGVFVADYLGHLAESHVNKANLWALYNGRDKRMGDYGLLATGGDPDGINVTRPSYWAMRMVANTLYGKLVQSKSNKETLESWVATHDGKVGIVLVNKNQDTEFKTKLKIPGLTGKAKVLTLIEGNSYGKQPTETQVTLSEGMEVSVPKYSVVVIQQQ